MPRTRPLALSELPQLLNRVRATLQLMVRDAKPIARRHGGRATAPPNGAKQTRGRRASNPALENRIIALVRASRKTGIGSVELAKKTSTPKQRVKAIAQKLKAKHVFKVIGIKRGAKYVFVG